MIMNQLMNTLEEGHVAIVAIEGDIPAWLNGRFISNGPGQFQVGNTQFKHWFDGFALLKSFSFKEGHVEVNAKYLKSLQYTKSNKRGELFLSEFGTSNRGITGVMRNLLYGSKYDNTNINIVQVEQGKLIAMTETANVVVFEKVSLDTMAIEKYTKAFTFHVSTAHPIRDYKRNTLVNVSIRFGYKNQYKILETDLSTGKCECIARYYSKIPFYMHSFAMTENYVILYQTPVIISTRKALSPWRPIIDAMDIKPELGSKVIVINRNNGESSTFTTETFYCFHSSNAYEKNNDIILDLITTNHGDYSIFTLDNMDKRKKFQSSFTRFTINMKKNDLQKNILYSDRIEFPRINESASLTNDYTYSYMCNKSNSSSFFNQILKLNVKTSEVQAWHLDDITVGEPVFVQNEKNKDDGILMVLLHDAKNNRSGMAIICSQSLKTIAIVWLSCLFPQGLHGQFFHDDEQ